MLHKVRKMEKNRSIPWHFTLSDDDYTTTSEDNNSSECMSTLKGFIILFLPLVIINTIIFIFYIYMEGEMFVIVGNKSESKDGSKEEIQASLSVGFETIGAVSKIKSVKDSKVYFVFKCFPL